MASRVSAVALVCVALALGCRGADAAGTPSQPMTLTFEPAALPRAGSRLGSGNLRCDVDRMVVAHGCGDHLVTLQSLTSTFADSTGVLGNTISASAAEWFGVTALKRDETATTHRQPTGAGPFTLTTSLTYLDQFGTSKVATFALTCTG